MPVLCMPVAYTFLPLLLTDWRLVVRKVVNRQKKSDYCRIPKSASDKRFKDERRLTNWQKRLEFRLTMLSDAGSKEDKLFVMTFILGNICILDIIIP